MSTTNPAHGACPVGTAVFFPWLAEPPNSDWVKCDGKIYPKGEYPKMDTIRATQPTNCRIDKQVYYDGDWTRAISSTIRLTASSCYNLAASVFKVFKECDPINGTDDWWCTAAGEKWIAMTLLNNVKRQFTGVELTARKSGTRYFPQKVKLQASDPGDSAWRDLTDEVSLTDPGSAGHVYIPVQYPAKANANMLRLLVTQDASYTAIARMRVFAKEEDLITPKIDARIDSQIGIWCLRVAA